MKHLLLIISLFYFLVFPINCQEKPKQSKPKLKHYEDDPQAVLRLVNWGGYLLSDKKLTWKNADSLYRYTVKKYAKHKNIQDFKSLAFFAFFDFGEFAEYLLFKDDGSKQAKKFIQFYKKEYESVYSQHPGMAVLLCNTMKNRNYPTKEIKEFAQKILEKNKKVSDSFKKELKEVELKENKTESDFLNISDLKKIMKYLEELEKFTQ